MRLPDEDYYQDEVTAHTAQGDLYEDVPFGHTTVLDSGFEAVGARPRPGEDGAYDAPLVTFHIQTVAPHLFDPADMGPDTTDSWAATTRES